MSNQCRRALVEGRVQGVWFRRSTQQEATRLGVVGWVRNLPDGRVEVLMCGAVDALDQLQAWLRKGPPAAEVSQVSVNDETWQHFDGFTVD